MNLFKRKQYVSVNASNINEDSKEKKNNDVKSGPAVPDGMCVKCTGCGKTVFKKEIGAYRICPECGHYFRIKASK